MLTIGRASLRKLIPAIFVTLTFVAMTQLPLPDRTEMVCPIASATAQLRPFAWTQSIIELYRWHADDPIAWIGNRALQATAMNFLICVAIGWTLASTGIPLKTVAIAGAALTLGVETTQLTGAWRLYPCAWRQFNVDDLMLNFLGTVSGATAWRAKQRK